MGVATMVITPGERVRKQAIGRFRLRPDRVIAIPEAAAPWFRPAEPFVHGKRYFLFVGTIEPRKNVTAMIDAWREVRRDLDIDLLIAGRTRADAPPLASEPGLRLMGEVADDSLRALYSGALAVVYPSLYEGFGLPVLEAMQCGAVVIASKAVEEVGGNAVVYADDSSELARAMREIASSVERLAELRSRSLAHARLFTWDRTARQTYEVYREARKRFGR
jgi:alpha-1,3-rhamnosyl/mannosyltransferase